VMEITNIMRKTAVRRVLLVLSASATLVIGSVMHLSPAAAEKPAEMPRVPTFVPGEVLVVFEPSVSERTANGLLRQKGLEVISASETSDLVRVRVAIGQEEETAAALLAGGGVRLAAPNHILYADFIPNDPSYGLQWGLPKIQAPAAWDMTTGSSNVTIAVVDSGLDMALAEFSGRIVHPRDFVNVPPDDDPEDTCTHGTHVAGIAAAMGNNGVGVAGAAWNVNVMPIRSLTNYSGNCTGTEADIYDGIHWAVDNGAQIINLSLGRSRAAADHTCEQDYPTMSSAVQYAYDAGVLVVAATGNNGVPRDELYCPAYQTAALAVGATDSSDNRAYYSNYGPGIDVVAPGSSVYSTLPGGSYGYKSGTSMATPYVAGLAALLWSMDASLSRDDVWTTIEQTSDDLGSAGWDEQYGYGRINALQALDTLATSLTPADVAFLIDDFKGPLPAQRQLMISTTVSSVLTWTATISPSVSWVTQVVPSSGTVSIGSPSTVTLSITRPVTYGAYTTTLWVNAVNAWGVPVRPRAAEARVTYVHELDTIILLPVLKGHSSD
jgi:thermitase